MNDYLNILELPDNYTEEDVKHNYKRLCTKWHPDKYPNEEDKVIAEEKFKLIQEAYNSIIKGTYNNEVPIIRAYCKVSIKDIYLRNEVEVKYEVPESFCPKCHGLGYIKYIKTVPIFGQVEVKETCQECFNKEYKTKTESFKFKINSWNDISSKIIPIGKYKLALNISIDMDKYNFHEDMLSTFVYVNPVILTIGGDIDVELPDETSFKYTIPRGTSNYGQFIIPGKGLFGENLLITTIVYIPTELTKKEEKLYKELYKEFQRNK